MVENYNDFFEQLKENKNKTEDLIFDLIRKDWGFSSVTLKDWLEKYHPLDLERNYTKQYGLNADLFLPITSKKSGYMWSGSIAVSRLKLAMLTKAYIIFHNYTDLKDNILVFQIECLRLWIRIDSLRTKCSLYDFTEMYNDAIKQAIENSDWLYEYLLEKQKNFQYVKTVYHFKKEDFDSVQPYMTLSEAYEDWMKYRFPHLLEYYKRDKIREYLVYCLTHQMSAEYKEIRYNKLKAELDGLKIKEPSLQAFRKLLSRHNIQYKLRSF